jgi:hypothetical protein
MRPGDLGHEELAGDVLRFRTGEFLDMHGSEASSGNPPRRGLATLRRTVCPVGHHVGRAGREGGVSRAEKGHDSPEIRRIADM